MDVRSVILLCGEELESVRYDIISESRDQQGQRVLILLREDKLELILLTVTGQIYTLQSPFWERV